MVAVLTLLVGTQPFVLARLGYSQGRPPALNRLCQGKVANDLSN